MIVTQKTHHNEMAKALIRRHEGVRTHPYQDSVGKLTIGVGRNLTDRGLGVDEVNVLFENDIDIASQALDIWLTGWRDFSPSRKSALLSMAFNLGAPRLCHFVKLRSALIAGDFDTAAAEALDSKWARQVGGRADEIAALIAKG